MRRDRVCSIFSGAENFRLPHGRRQLSRGTKHDIICLQTAVMHREFKTPNYVKQRFLKEKKRKNEILYNKNMCYFFPIIGEKNNQSSVSDAD